MRIYRRVTWVHLLCVHVLANALALLLLFFGLRPREGGHHHRARMITLPPWVTVVVCVALAVGLLILVGSSLARGRRARMVYT